MNEKRNFTLRCNCIHPERCTPRYDNHSRRQARTPSIRARCSPRTPEARTPSCTCTHGAPRSHRSCSPLDKSVCTRRSPRRSLAYRRTRSPRNSKHPSGTVCRSRACKHPPAGTSPVNRCKRSARCIFRLSTLECNEARSLRTSCYARSHRSSPKSWSIR